MLRICAFALIVSAALALPVDFDDGNAVIEDLVANAICSSVHKGRGILALELIHLMRASTPSELTEIESLLEKIYSEINSVNRVCAGDFERRRNFMEVRATAVDDNLIAHIPKRQLNGKPMPMVLVPGLTVPPLEAQLKTKGAPHVYCTQHSGKRWVLLWLSSSALLPGLRDCFEFDIKMALDETTGRFLNTEGVTTRVKGFGGIESVSEFNILGKHVPVYQAFFGNLTANGWVAGKSLRVAQFDFRLDPESLLITGYFAKVQQLVEETFVANENTRVHLMGHSMGSFLGHRFLLLMTSEWKAKYIESFIALCGPYAGSGSAIAVSVAGMTTQGHGIGITKDETIDVSQYTPVTYSLYPQDFVYGPEESVFYTPSKNYSLSEMDLFFEHHNLTHMPVWRKLVANSSFNTDLSPPGVFVHCINGFNVSTLSALVYSNDTLTVADTRSVDGDSVVPRTSLNVCQGWASQQKENVTSLEIPGLVHGNLPFIQDGINFLMSLMMQN